MEEEIDDPTAADSDDNTTEEEEEEVEEISNSSVVETTTTTRITVFTLAAEQPIMIGDHGRHDDDDYIAVAEKREQITNMLHHQQSSLTPPASPLSPPSPVVKTLPPSLQCACELVQTILTQMSLKDAPPVNEKHHHQQLYHQVASNNSTHGAPIAPVTSMHPAGSNNNNNINPSTLEQSSSFSTTGGANDDDDDDVGGCGEPQSTATTADGEDTATEAADSLSSPAAAAAAAAAAKRHLVVVKEGGGEGGASSIVSAVGSAAAAASLATTTSFPEGHPVPLYHQLYQQQQQQQSQHDKKLGHQALETLCHWTLQMLQQQNSSNKEAEIPRHIETQQQQQQQQSRATTISRTASSGIGSSPTAAAATAAATTTTTMSTSSKASNAASSVLTPWRKKKPMLLPPTHRPTTTATAAAAASQQQPQQRTTVRLQMFGSEYARHLSTSALAPSKNSNAAHSHHPNTNNSNNNGTSSSGATTIVPGMMMDTSPHGGGATLANITSSSTRKSRRSTYNSMKKNLSSSSQQPTTTLSSASAAASTGNRLLLPPPGRAPPRTFSTSFNNLEDAALSVQTGAILDIVVTTHGQAPPMGYYRISCTATGRPFALPVHKNGSSGGRSSLSSFNSSSAAAAGWMHLNVKKETSWDKAAQRPCITALTVIFPDRHEFVPPGFCLVRHVKASTNSSSSNSNSHNHGATNGNNTGKNNGSSDHANAGQPADIGGGGNGAERVFLCFRRSREGNPITAIVPLSPGDSEDVPLGFTVVERTPRNFCANLNPICRSSSSSSGISNNNGDKNNKAMFLAYRQRLANLETLRPLPLVLSVVATRKPKQQQQANATGSSSIPLAAAAASRMAKSTTKTSTWLQAYYATGGTVVSAQIGRFHIMDRSTHSLLSPSSVANRLALIEKSRQESGRKSLPTSSIRGDDLSFAGAGSNNISAAHYARSCATASFESEDATAAGGGASRSNSFSEHYSSTNNTGTSSTTRANTSMAGDDTSQTSLGGGGCGGADDDEYGSLSSIFRIKSGRSTPGSATGNGGSSVAVHGHSLFCLDQAEAQRYIQAMSFIPIVQAAIRPDTTVVLRLHARTTLIAPILTACYNRHGGSALVAVEGLFGLLKAGFFQDDVDLSSDDTNINGIACDDVDNNSSCSLNHDESSTRLTLLDLAIQVVCDVATTGAQETNFGACVEFVETAVRFSQAQLNTRTIGYVVRFYLFVFYFGASVPTSSTQQWPNPAWAGTSKTAAHATSISSMSSITDDLNHGDGVAGRGGGGGMGGDNDDGPMSPPTETFENSILFDPRSIQPSSTKAAAASSTYLPGGAPQSAALSFKELISLSIVRLGKISVNDILITCGASSSLLKGSLSDVAGGGIGLSATPESLASLLENLLSDVVDDAVDHVERANYTQLALHQIHRSGGSELFWHDMINACGAGLFGKDPRLTDAGRAIYIMIFAVMANLVKVSSDKIRGTCPVDLMPRDVASKILALELLLHFLEYWSDEQEAVSGMELMASEQTARVVSVDTLAFTIRRMVVPCLLSNTKSGLEDPEVFKRVIKIATELWRSPICRSHCKAELGILVDHFALRLLEMGPQLIASTKIDLWSDQAHISFRSQQMDLLKELKNMFLGDPKDAIEFYLNYDTNLTSQMTGPTHLLPGSQWKLFSRLCAGLCGIAEQCGELIGRQIAEHRDKINSRPLAEMYALSSDDGTPNSTTDKAAVRESARLLRTSSLEAISQIVRAIAISVGATKGPKFASLFLSWAPVGSPIAYENLLSSSRLGQDQTQRSEDADAEDDDFDDVLRESENNPDRKSGVENHALDVASELARQKTVRKAVEYLIACNALTPAPRDIATYLRMHKTRFEPAALGQYLGECGVGGTETEYWNSIRLSYVRAISFLGMNVDEALRHFLTNSGFRLPGEAQKIDRIIQTFAQCFFEDNAGDAQLCPFKNEDTVYLLCFAVIMLNTDLHKACQGSRRQRKKMSKIDFINNLRGIEQGEDIPRDYLSGIYDSIENSPIVMSDDEFSRDMTSNEDQHKNLQDMLNNTRSAESLLRGLAVHDFRFATIEDLAENLKLTPREALAKLTRSLVKETWHQWHSVISTCLETAHLDLQGMEPCVDILLYALSITVCLDMPTERTAFLGQLGRLKSFEELRQGRWVHAPDYESFRGEAWYLELDEACCGTDDRKIWALRNIREWMESVQEALLDDVRNKAELTKACAQLDDGDTLLQDPARSFVRAGKLTKKSGRTGRSTEYHFVLFSDLLLYSKGEHASGGKYKIHEELPLHLTKVVDWFPSSQKNKQQNVFEIHHPRKSFQVVCRDAEERKSWVKDIREAILMEVERKMMLEAARLAVHISKA